MTVQSAFRAACTTGARSALVHPQILRAPNGPVSTDGGRSGRITWANP
ncbi:hypothetical protein [Tessaracoccus rhinocerotis]|nr:hypothetical protein [Tessaracoccus rhinocerotis]